MTESFSKYRTKVTHFREKNTPWRRGTPWFIAEAFFSWQINAWYVNLNPFCKLYDWMTRNILHLVSCGLFGTSFDALSNDLDSIEMLICCQPKTDNIFCSHFQHYSKSFSYVNVNVQGLLETLHQNSRRLKEVQPESESKK